MSIAQASYMTESSSLQRAKKSITALVVTVFIAVITVLSGFTTFASSSESPQGQVALAGPMGFLCSSDNALGNNMDQGPWDSGMGIPHREATGRYWTAQEAFGNNVSFANYHGEGEAKDRWFVNGVSGDRGKDSGSGWTDNLSKYEELRDVDTCLLKMGVNGISNVGLTFAGGVSRIAQVFAVFAFDSNIICKEAGVAQGGCIDLLKIIGGTGTSGASTQGLIGTLTSGIYLPLLVIIVCISGLWVGYKGLVQRKFREAMFGAIWIFLSVIWGLTFLYKPAILAKAPMVVSNTVAACVVGGYTGNSCWDGGGGGGSPVPPPGTQDSKKMCISTANGIPMTEQMSMSVNSLSCSIWEAFVLEPFAQGSFGRSVDELNVDDTVVAAAISKAGLSKNDFCVNLVSSQSANGMPGTLSLDSAGNSVCNLAVYQAYLQTNATSAGKPSTQTASTPDTRWYNLINVVASDPGMWEKWSPDGAGNRVLITFVANVAAGLGSLIIIVISFFALMYYLTSVIMITFAPLFFLIGVHPGRGRSILIGWAEVVVANVLKYMASAFFLIISIAFYAAVLGSAKNVGLSLLFILVLTGALFLYRKEIVNLIGKVNMGGERLSNTAAQKLEKFGDKASKRAVRMGTTVAGSAVGAAAATAPIGSVFSAGKNISELGLKEGLKTTRNDIMSDLKATPTAIKGGMRDGMMRELKRGHGVVATATRSFDRISQDNKRDLNSEANTARDKANDAEEKLTATDNQRFQAQDTLKNSEREIKTSMAMYESTESKENMRREVDTNVVADMTTGFAGFAEMQAILDRVAALKAEQSSLPKGDPRYANLAREIQNNEMMYGVLMSQAPAGTIDAYAHSYATIRDDAYARAGVSDEDIRAGRVSLADATAKRSQINLAAGEMFAGAVPLFMQLEGTMHRLDALKMERDIAERAGDHETAKTYQTEIAGLEQQKNRLQGSMDTDVQAALTENMNKVKNEQYMGAGLAHRAENADEAKENFVALAAGQKIAEDHYREAAARYNSLTDARNKHAEDAASAGKRAEILQTAVTDMTPGSSMTNSKANVLRREAAYQGQKADVNKADQHTVLDTNLLADRRMPMAPEPVRMNPNGGAGVPPTGGDEGPTPGGLVPVRPSGGVPRDPAGPGGTPPSRFEQKQLPGGKGPEAGSGPDGPPPPPPGGGTVTPVNKAGLKGTAASAKANEPLEGKVVDGPNTVTPKTTAPDASATVVKGEVVDTPPVTPVTSRFDTKKQASAPQAPKEGTDVPLAPGTGVPVAPVDRGNLRGATPAKTAASQQEVTPVEGTVVDGPRTVAPKTTAPNASPTVIKGEVVEPGAVTPTPSTSVKGVPVMPADTRGTKTVNPSVVEGTVVDTPASTPRKATAPAPQAEVIKGEVVEPTRVTPAPKVAAADVTTTGTVKATPPVVESTAVETPVRKTPVPTAPASDVVKGEVVRETTAPKPSNAAGTPATPPAPTPPGVTPVTPSTAAVTAVGAAGLAAAATSGNKETVVKETIREVPTPPAARDVVPPAASRDVAPAVAPPVAPQASGSQLPTAPAAKETVREVVRETPATVAPSANVSRDGTSPREVVTPAPAAGQPTPVVTPVAKDVPTPREAMPAQQTTPSSTVPTAPAKETVREVVRETPTVTPSAVPKDVTPVTPPASVASTPQAQTAVPKETIREVVKETPAVTPVPTPVAKEAPLAPREPMTPPAAAPAQAQTTPKETIREVVKEAPATPTPAPAAPRDVPPARETAAPPAAPTPQTPPAKETIREVVKEAPAVTTPAVNVPKEAPVAPRETAAPQTPAAPASKAPEVREVVKEVPVAQAAPTPQAPAQVAPQAPQQAPALPEVREVVREAPAKQAPPVVTPPAQTSSTPEVREVIREVQTPASVAPATPATPAQPVAEPREVVKEIVREVPTPQATAAPIVTPASKTPEVREVVREVQTPAPAAPQPTPAPSQPQTTPEVREVIREVQTPAPQATPAPTPSTPQAAPEIREVVRETPTASKTPEVREVIREVPTQQAPQATPTPEVREVVREIQTPGPAAPQATAPPQAAPQATPEVREVVKETVREVPVAAPIPTPTASSAPEVREVIKETVREVPSQQAPQATSTPEVREVIREVQTPAPAAPQPAAAPSQAPEVREVIREVPAQQAPAATPPQATPEVRETVREVVKEVPVAAPAQASAPEVREVIREVPAQQATPEVREVAREAPAPQAPQAAPAPEVREVIKETVREVPVATPAPAAPQPAEKVTEVIRETVREVPAPQAAPEVREVIKETVREVPAQTPQPVESSSSSSRNMSDEQIRAMVQERGEALSSRERATLEETLRTAKLAQPNNDGSNNSTLQRAAENARRDLDAMTAKMAAADARHASEKANLEGRLASAERSANDAQRSAREASQAAAEARRGHGIPTAAPAETKASKPAEAPAAQPAEQRPAEQQPTPQGNSQSNSNKSQGQRANEAPATAAERPQNEDKGNPLKNMFGRKGKGNDNLDGNIDYTAPRPRRR